MINGRLQSSLTLTINSPQQQTYKSARYRPHPPSRHVCNPLTCIYSTYSCNSISLEQVMAYRSLRPQQPLPRTITTAPPHRLRLRGHRHGRPPLPLLSRRRRTDEFDANFDQDRVVGHSAGGRTLPWIDLHDEVTPFDYGAPGVRRVAQGQYSAVWGTSSPVP